MHEDSLHTSPLIGKILKEMPIFTRFKVYLEMEFLTLTLEPNTCCTQQEFAEAHEWSSKVTNYLLDELKEWEAQGRPGGLPQVESDQSDTNKTEDQNQQGTEKDHS